MSIPTQEITRFDTSTERQNFTYSMLYSTYLGGSNRDKAMAITVDGAGHALVSGHTQSNNFPILNPYQATRAGNIDAFLVELDPGQSGSGSLLYGTYLGGSSYDDALGIDLDMEGNVYLSGFTQSTNFPTANPLQPALGGGTCGTRSCEGARSTSRKMDWTACYSVESYW